MSVTHCIITYVSKDMLISSCATVWHWQFFSFFHPLEATRGSLRCLHGLRKAWLMWLSSNWASWPVKNSNKLPTNSAPHPHLHVLYSVRPHIPLALTSTASSYLWTQFLLTYPYLYHPQINAKWSPENAQQAIKWIGERINEPMSTDGSMDDVYTQLKDGLVLCK